MVSCRVCCGGPTWTCVTFRIAHMFVSVDVCVVCRFGSFTASLCGPWVQQVLVSGNSIVKVNWR